MMNSKLRPQLYLNKADCCGCMACYALCPKKAIYIVSDAEGFEYPEINDDDCVKCYMCVDVCPIKKEDQSKNNQ